MKFRTIRPTVWKGIRWVTGDRAGNGTRLQRQKPDNGLAAEAEAIVGVGEPTHAHHPRPVGAQHLSHRAEGRIDAKNQRQER